MWKYYNPVQIFFDIPFDEKLNEITTANENYLIVCSKRFKKSQEFERIKYKINNFVCFTDTETNPSIEVCNNAIEFGKKVKPNGIIAIGGGSIIDIAKSIVYAINGNKNTVESLLESKIETKKKVVFYTIPTTHGTGSELTKWATIWDKNEKKKYSISNNLNYPDYAIYDVSLFKSLPINQSLITTLDSLSHAFEALWNKNNNPISDYFALESVSIIFQNIDKINSYISDETRKLLIKAAIYSGLAFSNTKTAAAHSISYPLTSYFNIPHGIACSMPLFPLLRINENAIKGKIIELMKRINIKSLAEFEDKMIQTISNKIKFSLKEFNVKENDLKWLIDLSFTKGRMDNNIVDLSRIDVNRILENIF